MGVLGQLDPPKSLGQEIRMALASVLQIKSLWFYAKESLPAFHVVASGTSSELTPSKEQGKSFCIRGRFCTAKWPNPDNCTEEKLLEEIIF